MKPNDRDCRETLIKVTDLDSKSDDSVGYALTKARQSEGGERDLFCTTKCRVLKEGVSLLWCSPLPYLAIARSQLCPGSECVAEPIGPFVIDNSVDDSPLMITVVRPYPD